jgi:hypothetical protein
MKSLTAFLCLILSVNNVAEFMGFVAEAVFGVLEVREFFSPPVFGVGTWFGFRNVFLYHS